MKNIQHEYVCDQCGKSDFVRGENVVQLESNPPYGWIEMKRGSVFEFCRSAVHYCSVQCLRESLPLHENSEKSEDKFMSLRHPERLQVTHVPSTK